MNQKKKKGLIILILVLVPNWTEEARLLHLLENRSLTSVIITSQFCETTKLTFNKIQESVIAIIRDTITLVLPGRGRSACPNEIVRI